MTSTTPLDVKVVYEGSSRSRARGGGKPRAAGRRAGVSLAVFGVLNVLAAGGLCYAIWWPADKYIAVNMILRTPIEVDVNAAAKMIVPGLAARPRVTNAEEEPPQEPVEQPTISGRTAQIVIPATGYSWLTLSTIACCVVGLAGGTAFGRAGGSRWRRAGVILSAGGAIGLAFVAFDAWMEYGVQFPVSTLRFGMAGLVGWTVLLGLAMGRAVRGLSRLAAIVTILAAVGSIAALVLGRLTGAVKAEEAPLLFMLVVFTLHSLWGWVLSYLSPRVRLHG